MRFLTAVKGCIRLARIQNTEVREELQVYTLKGKIKESYNRWKEHPGRINQH